MNVLPKWHVSRQRSLGPLATLQKDPSEWGEFQPATLAPRSLGFCFTHVCRKPAPFKAYAERRLFREVI
jgi:hypothetical protein